MPKKSLFHRRPQIEPNPQEQCNYVTTKEEDEDLTDSEEVPMKEGREITMASSKERNNGGKTITFKENDTIEILIIFPPNLSDIGSFFYPLHCRKGRN